MNILLTLPKNLIEKIISGEKVYEMRKRQPFYMILGIDGFFVVEKGTSKVRCWCRVDNAIKIYIDHYVAAWYARPTCVTEEYMLNYAGGKEVCLMRIGKVIEFESLDRSCLGIDKNPQQYVYCPLIGIILQKMLSKKV